MKRALLVVPLSIALAVLGVPCDAQDKNPESDPVLDSAQTAIKEGRFSDEEKILRRAIQSSDQNDSSNPRLADYRDALVWAVYEQGRRADAEKIARDAVVKAEAGSPQSPQLADALESLGRLLAEKSQLTESLALLHRALAINQGASEPNNESIFRNLISISGVLGDRGNEKEQEGTLKQALDMVGSNQGFDSNNRRFVLELLSQLYIRERRFPDAEALLLEGMRDCAEKKSANFCEGFSVDLGSVYRLEGRTDEAQSLAMSASGRPPEEAILDREAQQEMQDHAYASAEDAIRRLIASIEQHPDYPDYEIRLMFRLKSLATVLGDEGRIDEAEGTYERLINVDLNWVIRLRGAAEGRPRDSDFETLAGDLSDFLDFCRDAHMVRDAEPVVQHALSAEEGIAGTKDSGIVTTLVVLAGVFEAEGAEEKGKYEQALPLYERALSIRQTELGTDDPRLEDVLSPYLTLLQEMHQDAQAAALEARIEALDTQDERKIGADASH